MTRQLILGVADAFVDRILRVVHGEGLMRDHFQVTRGRHRYEIGLGCPTLGGASAGGERAATQLELWIEERPIVGLPSGPSSGRAVIDALTRIGLSSTDDELVWTVDLASTPPSGITVDADVADLAGRLHAVCGDLLATALSASFTTRRPRLGPVDLPHARVIRDVAARATVFGFGETTGGRVPGTDSHPVAGEDWTISLDAETIRDVVIDAARATFGGWPEGAGAQPILLSHEQECGIDTFLGCLDHYDSRTYLDTIRLDFERGALALTGTLRQVNSAFYAPDWTATFAVRLGWFVWGTRPQMRVLGTDVEVGDVRFETQIRDLVRLRIEDAISRAVEGVTREIVAAPLIDGELMSKIVNGGSGKRIEVATTWSRAQVGPQGFVFAGRYNFLETSHRPVARLTLCNVHGVPGRKLLSAVLTRTPTARLRRVTWQWGDGSRLVCEGHGLRTAQQHDYEAGRHVAGVVVEDSEGGVARASLAFTARALRLVHRALPGAAEWTFCDRAGAHDLHFLALSDETPVEGVEVEVRGAGWSAHGVSDQSGEARVTVRQEDGWSPPLFPGGLAVGRLEVLAAGWGHVAFGPRSLTVHDCQSTSIPVGASLGRRFAELVERGRDVEARSPRAPVVDGGAAATLAVLAPVLQALEQGAVPEALARLLAVSTMAELVDRVSGTMDALGGLLGVAVDPQSLRIGPAIEAPQRHGRVGDQPAGVGWVLEHGGPT